MIQPFVSFPFSNRYIFAFWGGRPHQKKKEKPLIQFHVAQNESEREPLKYFCIAVYCSEKMLQLWVIILLLFAIATRRTLCLLVLGYACLTYCTSLSLSASSIGGLERRTTP